MLEIPDFTLTVWTLAMLSTLLIGISKGGIAGGVGVIGTPLMALAMPVAEAAAILLPLLIAADTFTWPYYVRRDKVDRHSIRLLLPSSLVGILVGGLTFSLFIDQDDILKIGIALLAFAFIGFQIFFGRDREDQAVEDVPSGLGILMGAIGGFTSTIAHIGGPPIAVYLLPRQLHRTVYIGTTAVVFAVINLVKLIPYYLLGVLSPANFTATLILAPVALIGVRLGIWINWKLNQKLFVRLVYLLLFLTGVQLILDNSLVALLFR